jgi:hypothetical protein
MVVTGRFKFTNYFNTSIDNFNLSINFFKKNKIFCFENQFIISSFPNYPLHDSAVFFEAILRELVCLE